MDGQAVGELVVGELGQEELVDRALLEVGVEEAAVDARRSVPQRQVAEDVLAEQFGDGGAAVDEAAGDGDAVAVVVLEGAQRPGDRVDDPSGNPGVRSMTLPVLRSKVKSPSLMAQP